MLSDAEGGRPVVNNGMAMCKVHHAAYDQHLISVTAEYRVAVLRSAPRRGAELPDRDLLAQRHARFITYGGART
jgi:predicted restriction endonuclease